jgi:hypothetical protein
MKKFLLTGSLALLLLPALAFAGTATDVTITTSAVFSVNGIEVDMNGSSGTVESASVTGTTLSFTLLPGSSVSVIFPGRNSFALDGAAGISSSNICNSTVSKVTLSGATSETTVTLTPSATLCSDQTTSTNTGSGGNGPIASGGGGGGGGGGYVAPTQPGTQPIVQTSAPGQAPGTGNAALVASLQAQLQALLAQIAALTGGAQGSFSRDLQVGATGDDVKALQVYLNTHGYAVASSGAGSSGNETTKFGAATKAALIKLQKAAGISPAAGYFGAKTRAYIAANP